MNTFAVAYVGLTVGAALGFILASVLRVGGDADAPAKPEALTAEPREIVAVYEAYREMDERNAPRPPLNLRGGETEKEIKAWEKEQAKREKKRGR